MRSIYYIFFISLAASLITACSPTKGLEEDQYLLYSQKVKGNKQFSGDILADLPKQKPNRKFLGAMPYVAIYNYGKRHHDTAEVSQEIRGLIKKYSLDTQNTENPKKLRQLTRKKDKKLEKLVIKYKEGNWLMRAPGEKPAIFDTALISKSRFTINYYLFSKGYFNSSVVAKVDTISKKRVNVTFQVSEGAPYKIKSINDTIDDPTIKILYDGTLNRSVLKVGETYNEEKLSEERERIYKVLKNNGYYDMTRQYINFEIDSTVGKRQVNVLLIIQNPAGEASHDRYQISKIYFNTDVGMGAENQKPDTLLFNEIKFTYFRKNFSKRILDDRLKFAPGSFYNQDQILKSQRQLGFLDMYKFVNINFDKDNDSSNTLTCYVFASPQKRYSITQEYGVNVGQGYVPGPFGNITFRQRNTFGGFEIFETSIRYSIDVAGSATGQSQTLRNQEYGINFSLSFPRIYFPVLGPKANEYNPRSRLSVGFTQLDRVEFNRTNFRIAYSYIWQRLVHRQYTITPFDFNYVNSEIEPIWQRFLDKQDSLGNNIAKSFLPGIVSSANAFIVFNDNEINVVKKSQYFRPFIEVGGIIPSLFGGTDSTFLKNRFFQFFRSNIDYRYYLPTRRKNTLAMRVNVGYARPWGRSAIESQFVLPYEKYYFVGGSNSIRAWKPRRLGPGSYQDTLEFEQPGEMIMEASVEYRFKLFWFFDGAVFLDAGNVWVHNHSTLRTEEKSGADLDNFLSEIAVGVGYGLRLNFSFLILRFDLGTKLHDPSQLTKYKYFGKDILKRPPFGRKGQTVLNIGIGYPF